MNLSAFGKWMVISTWSRSGDYDDAVTSKSWLNYRITEHFISCVFIIYVCLMWCALRTKVLYLLSFPNTLFSHYTTSSEDMFCEKPLPLSILYTI